MIFPETINYNESITEEEVRLNPGQYRRIICGEKEVVIKNAQVGECIIVANNESDVTPQVRGEHLIISVNQHFSFITY